MTSPNVWKEWDDSLADALAFLEKCPNALNHAQYDHSIQQLPAEYVMLSLKGNLDADHDLNKASLIGLLRVLPFVTLGEFYVTSCEWKRRWGQGKFLLVTVMKDGKRLEISTYDDTLSVMLSERKLATHYKRYFHKEFSFNDRQHIWSMVKALFNAPKEAVCEVNNVVT